MKLLQINVTANIGSTGRIAEQIGATAMKYGWESYIAYGRGASKGKSRLIQIGSIWSILWHGVITRVFDKHGLGSTMATRQLIRKIIKLQPDIIHLHNIHGYYLNYKILFNYLKTTNIPVVWTLHDCWAFTGHCAHFVEADCSKWMSQCYDCPLKFSYPKSFVDRSKKNYLLKRTLFSALRDQLTIVTVSSWLKDYVDRSFLNSSRVLNIYNGIDLNVFSPKIASSRIKTSKKVVLGVSSIWNDSKGLGDFIKLRELLSPDIVIYLVGLSRDKISLPEGIECIERTEDVEELAGIYSRADVFVNPTYADTFPTVNLESLACGTPVVSYITGGAPESISPSSGIVVEQGSVDGLAVAVNTILLNGKEYYSSSCRERAEALFDKELCFKSYIDLYKELLASH